MLLRQIKYFVKVVECNSFTEAAEQCYISQSAISQQITALEKELGVKLLRREGRRFYTTAAGDYFYRQSRQLVDEANILKQETVKIGRGMQKRLRIGCISRLRLDEVYKAIEIFSASCNDIMPEIIMGGHDELYNLLKDDKVDININGCRRVKSKEVYAALPLFTTKCWAELSRRNPLAAKPFVTSADLNKLTCILPVADKYQEEEREFYKNVLGLESQLLFTESADEGSMLVLMNKGYMLTDCQHFTGGDFCVRVPLYIDDKQAECKYYAFWKRGRAAYIEKFAQVLRSVFQDKGIN